MVGTLNRRKLLSSRGGEDLGSHSLFVCPATGMIMTISSSVVRFYLNAVFCAGFSENYSSW